MAILVLAAALRLVGIRYGLPLAVLNPDESNIVPRAWRIGHGHLDPGWYDYPSLLMLLLAPVQAFFGAPALGAARVVSVVIGVGGVGAAWWLGRRAYGTGAAIVGAAAVAVATTHVAYSRMAVTDVLLALAVTCVLALAVEGRLEWAGLAVGLAASAKYPGALAAVPVVVAGWGRWPALGRAALLAVAGFALTSPFVLIHGGAAWGDISRVQRLARDGWLGFEDDPVTPVAYLDRLWSATGPFLLLALVGVVAALVRRTRTDLVLLSFVAVYWLTLMPQQAHFDRYVLPLVPVLAVLAGSVRVLVPVALVALVVPLVWSVADARELTRTDTRLRAATWVAAQHPQPGSDRGRPVDAAAARPAGRSAPVARPWPPVRPGARSRPPSWTGREVGRPLRCRHRPGARCSRPLPTGGRILRAARPRPATRLRRPADGTRPRRALGPDLPSVAFRRES